MKAGSENGWHCIKSLYFRGKPAKDLCLLQKVKNSASTPGEAPVYLNVYDLTPANGYVYWAGLGIFHSGIEGQFVSHLTYIRASE